jgi:Domain of unknown function (DUF6896)
MNRLHCLRPHAKIVVNMRLDLEEMIRQFRAAQGRGVAVVASVLRNELGVRLPKSNREWVSICAECGLLWSPQEVGGIQVYAHGYGIELMVDGLNIDFDWGDAGEPDGFDAWRLWNFYQVNGLPLPCESYVQLSSWLEEAAEHGELTKDELLYYSPLHRAT